MFGWRRLAPGEVAAPQRTRPMPITVRVDLVVPYVEKEDAKALGARWDKDRKVWFAPPGTDPSTLGRWLPRGFTPPATEEPPAPSEPEKGTALIDLLAKFRLPPGSN